MNTTSVNGPFVTSSAPRPDWASPSSPSRSLPEILFLSSAAKQSDPQGHGEAQPWPSLRLLRRLWLLAMTPFVGFEDMLSAKVSENSLNSTAEIHLRASR